MAECEIFECKTCWCITQAVGFKRLIMDIGKFIQIL